MPEKQTPAERSLIASIAANESWARTYDRSARTRPARQKFNEQFENEVDPDRVLPPAERAKRAENARKAYFARLALKSAKARRRRAGSGAALTPAQREAIAVILDFPVAEGGDAE